MMNILVTGIHGFVGSNLVEALKENCIFYGLDIVSPAKEGVVTTFLGKTSNLHLFLFKLFPNSMPLFILPERPMIRKTNQPLSPILTSIPV